MNSDIKQQWLIALRSGKYKQAKAALRKNDCFCAFGVLCDIFSRQHEVVWTNAGGDGEFHGTQPGSERTKFMEEWYPCLTQ